MIDGSEKPAYKGNVGIKDGKLVLNALDAHGATFRTDVTF